MKKLALVTAAILMMAAPAFTGSAVAKDQSSVATDLSSRHGRHYGWVRGHHYGWYHHPHHRVYARVVVVPRHRHHHWNYRGY